ncbi:nucleolar protein 16 [Lasallia pustulata]|uniref:Nucleolar protein 16 n=1 Tax=Lasallia pustulata TaxID=136370 RepID=A0A1W5CYK7_9LECA|nr:nucleolar protein 16 [Lasallia pustulata]
MGRELQKKKNKSSIPKVKHKPKSKRINPLGNAIVAANWDQSLTLSQNYRRLGLTSKLNSRTGGVEKTASALSNSSKGTTARKDSILIASKTPTTLIPTEARIERDPTTGVILRVIHPSAGKDNPLNDPLNDLSDGESGQNMEGAAEESPRGIIRELEQQALMEAPTKPRHQSRREEEWIAKLVEKYGEDYRAMVKDRKLNPYQQTEGDIKRRVKRWKGRSGG